MESGDVHCSKHTPTSNGHCISYFLHLLPHFTNLFHKRNLYIFDYNCLTVIQKLKAIIYKAGRKLNQKVSISHSGKKNTK